MANLMDYLDWRGDLTLEISPFNEVDALILAELSFVDFDGIVPPPELGRGLPLNEAAEAFFARHGGKDVPMGVLVPDTISKMLRKLMTSPRFRNMTLNGYTALLDDSIEQQFAALTIDLGNGSIYISFRGTDDTIVGWKEDLNMGFLEEIPSQKQAVEYVARVARQYSDKTIRIGGHSKGGNLAEYAALVADESAFERLRGVFNHDGPSFLDDPSPRIDDDRFHALLHKTVPESSAFGMILERRADYRVVRSSAMSVFQHEPFTWLTEDDDFVYQEALNPSAVFFDEALDAWLRSKAPDERERFIDTIYELFASTEAGTWSEFQTKLFANTRQLLGARSKLDAETKSFIWQTLGSLGGILKDETVKRFKPAPPTWLPRRRETYDPEKGTEA